MNDQTTGYGHPTFIGRVDPDDHKAIHRAITRHYRQYTYLPDGWAPRPDSLIDVSHVAQAALNAWLDVDTLVETMYHERIGHKFSDIDLSNLPYIAEPEINLHGIYIFGHIYWAAGGVEWGGVVAATVFGGVTGDGHAVQPYFIDEGTNELYTWNIGGHITPSLHMFPVGAVKAWNLGKMNEDEINTASEAAGTAQMAAAVVLLANSIANSDPRIVKVNATPDKVIKQARRKGRAVIDKTVVIELPGVRYDGKKWSGRRGDGVAWHMVRGHWRQINEERRTWVRPHSRGDASLGKVSHVYRVRTA